MGKVSRLFRCLCCFAGDESENLHEMALSRKEKPSATIKQSPDVQINSNATQEKGMESVEKAEKIPTTNEENKKEVIGGNEQSEQSGADVSIDINKITCTTEEEHSPKSGENEDNRSVKRLSMAVKRKPSQQGKKPKSRQFVQPPLENLNVVVIPDEPVNSEADQRGPVLVVADLPRHSSLSSDVLAQLKLLQQQKMLGDDDSDVDYELG